MVLLKIIFKGSAVSPQQIQVRVCVFAEAALLRVPARAQHRRDLHRRTQERDGQVVVVEVKGGGGGGQEGSRRIVEGPEALGGRAATSAAACLQELVVGERRRAPDGRLHAGLLPAGIHQLLIELRADISNTLHSADLKITHTVFSCSNPNHQ